MSAVRSEPAGAGSPSARVGPEHLEAWFAELGLTPSARADREGVTSWDLDLDGRRRFDLRATLILDPSLALIAWVQLAPPIGDRFRASYRKLLRWNDEFPFVKFAVAEDERPVLSAELPVAHLDADLVGLTLARLLAIADRLLDETADWLWVRGEMPASYGDRASRNLTLIERYADRLRELDG